MYILKLKALKSPGNFYMHFLSGILCLEFIHIMRQHELNRSIATKLIWVLSVSPWLFPWSLKSSHSPPKHSLGFCQSELSVTAISYFYGNTVHKICFSPVNLHYVYLILWTAKESRLEEGMSSTSTTGNNDLRLVAVNIKRLL